MTIPLELDRLGDDILDDLRDSLERRLAAAYREGWRDAIGAVRCALPPRTTRYHSDTLDGVEVMCPKGEP